MFRVPPWEFEEQISSAWVTKLMAFKNEYTLDPAGARAAAIIARQIAAGQGVSAPLDRFIDRREWVTQEEIADQQLQTMEAAFPVQ